MGKTPKVTVGEDFSYIVKNYLHEKFAKQLSKEEKKGNIRFQVIRDLGLDGQTNFGERGVLIKIKQDVAKSKFTCWRRAVVCHELGHALHFFETNGQIWEGAEHGEEWKNLMISAVKDGLLKDCAKELESPKEMCIFKENKEKCHLCDPNSKINV